MPNRIPRDEIIIEMDLLEVLAFKGFVCPEGVGIELVLDNWVIEPERDLTKEIIEECVEGEHHGTGRPPEKGHSVAEAERAPAPPGRDQVCNLGVD